MRLIVVHNHFRPGGVRRVIEHALPSLATCLGLRSTEILLVGGEPPEPGWLRELQANLRGVPVEVALDPALSYASEWKDSARKRRRGVRSFLAQVLTHRTAKALIWYHNPGLVRNLDLTRELIRATDDSAAKVIFHHHDWWFDNRWSRLSEIQREGRITPGGIARWILTDHPQVRHVAINRAEAGRLVDGMGRRGVWIPNLVIRTRQPENSRIKAASRWLAARTGQRAPVWILPVRLLRRKNVGEALLLMRWLRPEAMLVTTGGVSSVDESPYVKALKAAAAEGRWPLHLGVLADAEEFAPTVPELMAASEVVLMTSLIEGFGLPYVEAVAARKPLLARSLPDVAPDLRRFGFRFPHLYEEVRVDRALFNWRAEVRRQEVRFDAWRKQIPTSLRRELGEPVLLQSVRDAETVPFSRLTLAAQLEVLAVPPDSSWATARSANPWLEAWRKAASIGRLRTTPWPGTADRWLSGTAFASRCTRHAQAGTGSGGPSLPPEQIQRSLLTRKLATENLYPLLWTSQP